MATPRQPPTSYFGKIIIALGVLIASVALFFFSHSYFLSIATLLILGTGYAIYYLGMSTGLPGTSGRNGRNIRT